jgi:methylglyoxal synthase
MADRIGSVVEGKEADLIAVEGNPVDDITALQRVVFVMKAGRVYRNGREGGRLMDRTGIAILSPSVVTTTPLGAPDSIRAAIARGGVITMTVVRQDSGAIPIARYVELAPRIARLRVEPTVLRIAIGDTLVMWDNVRVHALDSAGTNLGWLSTYDVIVTGDAAAPATPGSRTFIGRQRGESTAMISFPRALWPGFTEPPTAEVKLVVR